MEAGVDIDAGSEMVRRIAKMAPGIGGFGCVFPLALAEMPDFVEVSLLLALSKRMRLLMERILRLVKSLLIFLQVAYTQMAFLFREDIKKRWNDQLPVINAEPITLGEALMTPTVISVKKILGKSLQSLDKRGEGSYHTGEVIVGEGVSSEKSIRSSNLFQIFVLVSPPLHLQIGATCGAEEEIVLLPLGGGVLRVAAAAATTLVPSPGRSDPHPVEHIAISVRERRKKKDGKRTKKRN
ncbi:phosphoribosylformylglycinamidine cyclo-ligase [Canna indica]|uniref:Phosphoribosylformylglycinamidine cyclo-ligase n=1 Tax=Canna indica TaxID=4628 RepID=A0AAQ3K705_9LILI|nr:phosphoribosylformylglycinamidine cyclo-ligase [Canna indica]